MASVSAAGDDGATTVSPAPADLTLPRPIDAGPAVAAAGTAPSLLPAEGGAADASVRSRGAAAVGVGGGREGGRPPAHDPLPAAVSGRTASSHICTPPSTMRRDPLLLSSSISSVVDAAAAAAEGSIDHIYPGAPPEARSQTAFAGGAPRKSTFLLAGGSRRGPAVRRSTSTYAAMPRTLTGCAALRRMRVGASEQYLSC